jgi:hypothetical protein
MSFDNQDPYDMAAWWFMHLTCQNCGVMLEYDSEGRHPEASDEFFHEYAQKAKRSGWHIVKKSPSPPQWSILCVACVEKKESA